LDNVVIVDSEDSLLIAAKGKIQDVKLVAEEMLYNFILGNCLEGNRSKKEKLNE
jgi:hypothetical protein